MSESPPPDKVWFKNTPENVAEFKRRWPDIRTVGGRDIDFLLPLGCYGFSVRDGNLEWCQTESYYPSLGYAELDLTPKAEPLPSAFWFEYTPENVAEFKRRYPDFRDRGSGSIDEHAEKIISLGNRIGEVGFACGSWGYTGPSNKGWYADQRTYQRLDLAPKPEPAKHDHFVELAKKCIGKKLDSVEMADLSNALYCGGFKFLAKAVLGGIKWSEDIVKGEPLADLERVTSGSSWSWNQFKEPPEFLTKPVAAVANPISSTKTTSVDLPWDDMKTMFAGPLNYVSPVSSVSTKEKDMTPSEIQTVIDAVTKNLKSSVVKDTKQSIFSRATGYTWGATKSTFGWVFAPVKKITQLTACLVALSGIAYGGYRAYDAIANMSMPTITWEAQADSSPSDAK